MVNYEELDEITVKSQEELDLITNDFKGTVFIEFGTYYNPAVVRKRYGRVIAQGNAYVLARDNSHVVAQGNSHVEAWGNAFVVARGDASVEAWENSHVEAWGNASVVAWGNSQVCDCIVGGKIEITGNARIVYYPKTIDEYCSFYGVERTKDKGRFYKCVHRKDDIYFSEYSPSFKYKLSEIISADSFDDDINEDCGHGIHIAHLNWVLNFGKDWNDLAIIEVEAELGKIVIPKCSNGKIRVPEVKVIREIPLEECGMYGKILAKRLRNREG